MTYVWIIAIILFAAIEAVSPQLITIWFAAGAIIALITDILGAPLWVQIAIFVVSSAALVAVTRPLAVKVNRKAVHTNADRIIGLSAIVTTNINNELAQGQIQVSGQYWTARSANGIVIPEGESVIVNAIEGVKAIVQKVS